MNYSRVALEIPEGGEFESESPGAPDRYCLMSGVPAWAILTSARAERALNARQRAVGAENDRCFGVAPDSPVYTGQSGEL